MTLVSVVVPTRDRPRLLADTLATILGQTHSELDVIVSDDGSDALDVTMVPGLSDPRVRLLRTSVSSGVAGARNRGLAAARGQHVAFCDDDDLWVADKLARQVAAMEASGCHWSYVSALVVTATLRPLALNGGPMHWDAAAQAEANRVPGGASGVLATRAALEMVGPFDPAFSQFADWDLWTRLASLGEPARVSEIGVLYRRHEGQMSADFSGMLAELEAFRRKHGPACRTPRPGLNPMDRYVVHQMRRAGAWSQAVVHVLRTCEPRLHPDALYTIAQTTLHRAGVRRRRPRNVAFERVVREVRAICDAARPDIG